MCYSTASLEWGRLPPLPAPGHSCPLLVVSFRPLPGGAAVGVPGQGGEARSGRTGAGELVVESLCPGGGATCAPALQTLRTACSACVCPLELKGRPFLNRSETRYEVTGTGQTRGHTAYTHAGVATLQ